MAKKKAVAGDIIRFSRYDCTHEAQVIREREGTNTVLVVYPDGELTVVNHKNYKIVTDTDTSLSGKVTTYNVHDAQHKTVTKEEINKPRKKKDIWVAAIVLHGQEICRYEFLAKFQAYEKANALKQNYNPSFVCVFLESANSES